MATETTVGIVSLDEARAYELHMERFVGEDPETRPHFHLTPRVGWMNDPNGFSYYQGQYHLFYQYNPFSCAWAPMYWGHAVSDDLLTWSYLPVALAPDRPYDDKEGCFSGSAIEMPDGRHLILYTGVGAGDRLPDGTYAGLQTQCVAIGDGVDYAKYEANPVIEGSTLPEGSSTVHFRDPKIYAVDGGYQAVMANLAADGSGQIALYESADGLSWDFVSIVDRNEGRYGVMWECPDLFALDGYDVLLVSPQDMLSEGHAFHSGNGTICVLGHLDEKMELVEESVRTIDHGMDFYATQTLLAPDGRRIMVAWMQNWDSTTGVPADKRWFGRMTLPRELSVRDGYLYQWPIRELEAKRGERVAYEGVRVGAAPLALDGISGRSCDLSLVVRPAEDAGGYREFVVWFAQDERFHCSLRYHPESGTLKMSRIHSGSRRAFVHHRKCDVPGAPDELRLRMVMDVHSVEVFVNDGIQTLTMTIPTAKEADGITFFAQGDAVVDVEKYELFDATDAVAR